MSNSALAQPIRILLVEDNQADARFIEMALREGNGSKLGIPSFIVDSVQRLSAGLARLTEVPVDVVLLDLYLPDSAGLSTFTRLHKRAPYTPVIILTGLSDEELAIQALGMGAQDYLIKGEVDGPLLTRAIRYAIERKRAEEDLRRHRDHLEELVIERTADLLQINERLLQEVMERRRAEEMLRRRNEELAALNTAIQAVVSKLELGRILELLLSEAIKLTGAWGASVLLYDAAKEELEFITVVDPVAEKLVGTRMPVSEGIAGWVLREQRAAVVRNVQQDPRFYRHIDALTGLTTTSLMALPLKVRERTIGVVELINKISGPFNEHDLELMETLTGAAASAIENAQLLEAVSFGKRKWEVTFDAITDGIVVVDRDWRIECINKALAQWLGSTVEEITGHSCAEIALHNERMAMLFSHMQTLQGTRPRTMEVSISQLGEEFLFSVYPLHGDIGSPEAAVYVIRDITESKRMERLLIHSERLAAMGKLAASIAHEVNNPLQSVLGCLGLAQEAQEEGESVAPYLQVAQVEIQRIARIIAQMRDLSRANFQMELELADINELVDQVLELTYKRCREQKIEVIWSPARDLPRIPVVSDQIKQVFLNLVLNAADAMPEGGELRIHTSLVAEQGMICVIFSDTGVGIPEEALPNIFEPFFSTKAEGTGLGLSISQNIVVRHGGRIEVDSRPGAGSTFTVWLPLRPEKSG